MDGFGIFLLAVLLVFVLIAIVVMFVIWLAEGRP